jgi:ubiquinone/menaquinone biosynthesis C-methylase UbiE
MNTQTAEELLGKVKKDYSRIAKPFDATRQSPWKEFDRFGSYLEANQRLLDIGCGNGRLFSFLKDKHVSYLGVDNNGVFLELAKKNFPDAEFRNADVLSLPFASASFDHVWNIAALHHIPSKALRMF